MRPKRWTAESRVLFALALGAGVARSQPGAPLTLDWTAPPGCPGRDDVRRRAEQLLGGPIEPRLGRPLRASGTVVAGGDRFELRLLTEDGGLRGERVLHGTSCEEVTSAAALIVALAVDPKAVAASEASGAPPVTTAPAASTPVANSAPPPQVVAPPLAVPAVPDRRERGGPGLPVTGALDVSLAADLGSLPALAVGPALGGAVGLGPWQLRLAGTYFAPRFKTAAAVAGKATRGADVSLLLAGLSGCYVLTPGAVELGACAALEGGVRFASGSGFDLTNDATTPWVAAGGFVELDVPLAGPFALRVEVGAMAPFGRSPVRFQEKTGNVIQIHDLYRPGAVSGRAALGLGMAFR